MFAHCHHGVLVCLDEAPIADLQSGRIRLLPSPRKSAFHKKLRWIWYLYIYITLFIYSIYIYDIQKNLIKFHSSNQNLYPELNSMQNIWMTLGLTSPGSSLFHIFTPTSRSDMIQKELFESCRLEKCRSPFLTCDWPEFTWSQIVFLTTTHSVASFFTPPTRRVLG